VIYDTVTIARTKVYDSRLRFIVYVDSRIPNVLYGDAAKIRQIMLNLLGNAVKYTGNGFVSLSIVGKMVDENKVTLTIEVADSGKGIRQSDLNKLFLEFSQLDAHKSIDFEGSGLGLAITQSFVNAMGGEISVDSEYGIGSTFTVTISQKVVQKQALADILDRDGQSVLVFDRREACRASIRKSMENLRISHKLVSTLPEFYDNVMTGSYTHIFTTPALYASVKKEYPDIKSDASIALLTEFGETSTYLDMSSITSPVFCIPVANFLNGIADKFTNHFDCPVKSTFIAPTARVLIVDDLKTNLVVTEGLLQPYGMQTDLCKSGAEAIVAVSLNRYDLVLMDHMMPVMDGIEATFHIRSQATGGDRYNKTLPIVAMTANAVAGMRETFLISGFSDYLSKPIDTTALDTILEAWIPEGKKERPPDSGEHENKKSLEYTPLMDIDGLDVLKGIRLTGGTYERYVRVLEEFHGEGLEKIRELENKLKAEDLQQFTIYAHAIKNGCMISGADDLAKAAGELESAGARGDIEFIRENVAWFILDLEKLLDGVRNALSSGSPEEKKDYVGIGALKEHLERYKTALKSYSTKEIREITGFLQSVRYDAETGRAVRDILHMRLIGNYDEALALISSLLDSLKEQ
jgi:CheY-like chemotaxis protein